MEETARLSRFLSEMTFEDLPAAVVERLKILLLDQLGCQLAFARQPVSRSVFALLEARAAPGPATLAYYGVRTGIEDAAFANGVFGHAFEMDDVELSTASHPGAVVIPAVLALAQSRPTSGRDILVALAAGYETMVRAGRGASGLIARGFHPTSALGPFGSAAASAKLLGSSALQIANALGIAGSSAAGTCEFSSSGGSVKRLHAGMAAQAGLRAALLAQAGVTGPAQILEGSKGFCQAVSATPDPQSITRGLGEEFALMSVGLKAHCCCGAYHSALDAVDALLGRRPTAPDALASVLVEQRSREVGHAGRVVEPADITEAQFSARFGVAMRIVRASNGFADYSEQTISDETILGLARRVEYRAAREDELVHPGAARVTLSWRDGRTATAQIDFPHGSPNNPMDWRATRAKFEALAGTAITVSKIEEIVDFVETIETAEEAGRLGALMGAPADNDVETAFSTPELAC